MIKIIAIPKKSKASPSVRMRYYNFLENLSNEFQWETYTDNLDGDVLYVEKNASLKTVNIAKEALKRGMLLFYDVDDPIKVRKNNNMVKMIKLADVVTVDTKPRKLSAERFSNNVVIIPDGMDYQNKPKKRLVIRDKIKKVVTFGYPQKIIDAAPYVNKANVERRYIGARKCNKYKNATFIKWKYKNFLDELLINDVVILVHGKTKIDKARSNNRLIAAMSIGMPTIVADSYAYKNIVKEAGHSYLVARTEKDVPRILNKIASSKVRQKISDDFFKYSWENYSSQKSSLMFAKLIKKELVCKKSL